MRTLARTHTTTKTKTTTKTPSEAPSPFNVYVFMDHLSGLSGLVVTNQVNTDKDRQQLDASKQIKAKDCQKMITTAPSDRLFFSNSV